MNNMNSNAISQLEQELLRILKEEYSFYQSLYILLDKQRDYIKFNKDEHLLDLYAEIERCQKRIQASEDKITDIQNQNPKLFRIAAIHPEIKKMVNCIVTLVKKNISLVSENEEYVKDRHERIRMELNELKSSRKILKYLSDVESSPQFVDGKK
ncbi:MAG: hypothetical protein JXA92_14050 [candidate division Zixibacteria bacterium]|nr:hypothetical protein [candidate division Zixibacteria bacterium]